MTSMDEKHERRTSNDDEEENIKPNRFTQFLFRTFLLPWLKHLVLLLLLLQINIWIKEYRGDSTMAYRTPHSSAMLGCAAFIVMIASLFFWLSAFSTPFIKTIYYLESRTNDVRFGNFGWCYDTDVNCEQRVGYHWRPEIPSGRGPTGAHILVALTAAFGTLAFFALLHSTMNLRSGAASFFLVMFTNLLAFISFLIVVITWGTTKRRFNDSTGVYGDANYGAALPLVIVGWLLFLSAIPLVFIGWFKNRGYRNDAPVTHATTTNTTTKSRRKFF